MKAMLIIFACLEILAATGARAEAPAAGDQWICTAVGNDMHGQQSNVLGSYRDTEEEARNAALTQCYGAGLFGCRVQDCLSNSESGNFARGR